MNSFGDVRKIEQNCALCRKRAKFGGNKRNNALNDFTYGSSAQLSSDGNYGNAREGLPS